MAKIRNPRTFSREFNVPRARLAKLGVVDVCLNVDTHLFIDPLLLEGSSVAEMREAHTTYENHFAKVIRLLRASKKVDDPAWRAARKALSFHEVKATGLGYGAGSVSGSGFGDALIERVLRTAKEIVDIGVEDPDLFVALAVFEEDIGPDRISDMTTNVILPNILDFNELILPSLDIPLATFSVRGRNVNLPRNRFLPNTPVLLVPADVLRSLPIATSWSDISTAAAHNEQLRNKVNTQIGEIWATRTRREKDLIRKSVLRSADSFNTLLELLHEVAKIPYDSKSDPQGELTWMRLLDELPQQFPLVLQKKKPDVDYVHNIAKTIVDHFRSLVEEKGLWKEFWADGKPRPEKSAQRLFFAVADAYCKANDLDITPEADSGAGPVDFKFSSGYDARVLVEVKLSTNSGVANGYSKQLEAYKAAEGTDRAIYVVCNLGDRDWSARLSKVRAETFPNGGGSDIEYVDATPQLSASKRK